jgi:hypothetical protein
MKAVAKRRIPDIQTLTLEQHSMYFNNLFIVEPVERSPWPEWVSGGEKPVGKQDRA